VDDHPAMLQQVERLLAAEFEVVDELPDGSNLDRAVQLHHPNLVVLDITLPGRSGLELAQELSRTASPPKLVMLTVHADSDYAREAFAAGAQAYVVKSRLADDLVSALHAALDGRRFISPTPELRELP